MEACEIDIKYPSLNEFIAACNKSWKAGNAMKQRYQKETALYIKRLPEYKEKVVIHFYWIEENRRRDCDNIAFAKKFILDALVRNGKLVDDGRKYVAGFTDTFLDGDSTKVVIMIEPVKETHGHQTSKKRVRKNSKRVNKQ